MAVVRDSEAQRPVYTNDPSLRIQDFTLNNRRVRTRVCSRRPVTCSFDADRILRTVCLDWVSHWALLRVHGQWN